MFKTLQNAFKIKELRGKILFTLFMVFVVRLGSQIPIPGTDATVIQSIIGASSEVANLAAMFSGGSLENFAIFALGIGPYITSSIIMQLLTIAIPALEEMQKDGEEGRKKIQSITRYVTIGLSLLQGGFLSYSLGRQGLFGAYSSMSVGQRTWMVVSVTLILTAGSACLMWIGERITEKGIGNGISIVLTVNILARIPNDFATLGNAFVIGKGIFQAALAIVVIAVVILAMVVFVIYLQDGVRKIPVQYSKKVQGNKLVGGQQSHIPLKVNTAGVIPVIFASTLMSIPSIIQAYARGTNKVWVFIVNFLNQRNWFNTQVAWYYSLGAVLYVLMIIGFAYFYTSITFNPAEVANNIKKNGGLIPSVRAGKPTEEFLSKILKYMVFIGAIGLTIVCIIPILVSGIFHISQVSFGGTSIIIIVGVILETLKQIESNMLVRNYKGFLNK